MKILHTADWHIGKQLYKHSLDKDLLYFFDWMIEFIKEEKVDVLIVAGDVYDLANPSHHSRKMYYDILKRLIELGTQVIITGGNHDSITNLESSSDLLLTLNVKIVGGVSDDFMDEIVKVEVGEETIIVAAVPYLRDKDVRTGGDFESDLDRIGLYQKGIVRHYEIIKAIIEEKYEKKYPVVGVGHLYLQSAKISDSERDIQLGNLAGVNASHFEKLFDYTALGHIHKPQSFCGGRVRYSGSPISLSFSERKDQKTVILIDTSKEDLIILPVSIPSQRALIKITGTLEEVRIKLEKYKETSVLPSYIEVEVIEKEYSVAVLDNARSFLAQFDAENLNIIKERVRFENSQRQLAALEPTKEIKDLKPIEVFEKRIGEEILSKSVKEDLFHCFHELETKAQEEH